MVHFEGRMGNARSRLDNGMDALDYQVKTLLYAK